MLTLLHRYLELNCLQHNKCGNYRAATHKDGLIERGNCEEQISYKIPKRFHVPSFITGNCAVFDCRYYKVRDTNKI